MEKFRRSSNTLAFFSWLPKSHQSITVAVSMVIAVALLEFVGLTSGFRQVIETVLTPFRVTAVTFTSLIELPGAVWQSSTVAKRRIQDLELRYAETTALLGELERTKTENQALRTILEASASAAKRISLASPVAAYGVPLISSGARQGVSIGNVVTVAQTLVGVVTEVSNNQSAVTLLNDRASQPLLAITDRGNTGIIRGDGRRVLLTELPSNASIEIGERVMTQGQAGIQPRLSIGRVSGIEADSASATKTAIIEQYVSFYESTIVEVE
ncbi:MAG: rod shape-determining protein MreC [bacterium]|nr:rod shape-determining protein MreC [bacterium]